MKKSLVHILVVIAICCGYLGMAYVLGSAETTDGQSGQNISAALIIFGGRVLFWTMAAGYGVAGLLGIFYRKWELGVSFVVCSVFLAVAPLLFNPVRLRAQPKESNHEIHETHEIENDGGGNT